MIQIFEGSFTAYHFPDTAFESATFTMSPTACE